MSATFGPRKARTPGREGTFDQLLTGLLNGAHAMSLSDRRQRIVDAVSITEIMGEYLPLHQSGLLLKTLCPFHDDHTISFEVEPVGSRFQCWACGVLGDVVDFVCRYENLSISDALDILEARPEP
jgi:DNA primase